MDLMKEKKLSAVALLFSLLILAPVIILFLESLGDGQGGVTVKSFEVLNLSPRQLSMLRDSLITASGAMTCSVIVGIPLAFLLCRTNMFGREFFKNIYLLPLMLPPYIQAIVWTRFPGMEQGIYSIPGAIFIFTLSFFPFTTLIASSGFKAMDHRLEEAAMLHHKKALVLRKITLPLVFPHIACGAILVFVFSIVNFEVADILRLKVYPLEIFIHFSAFYDEKGATVLSLPLIGATMAFVWIQMWTMRGKSYLNMARHAESGRLYDLGAWRYVAALYPFVLLSVCLSVPVYMLAKNAGPPGSYAQAWASGAGAVFYSLGVSAAGAAAMTVCAVPVSYYLVRNTGKIRTFVDFAVQIPFGVPSIVLGIGMITLWNRPFLDFLYGSSAIVVLAMVTAYSPFVIKVISAQIMRIDRDLEDAGRMGAGPVKVFSRILLPLILPAVVAGFVVGFVLSLSNLGTSLLLAAPGKTTLPMAIYNYMHYGADEMVCALSLFLLVLMAVPLFIGGLCYRMLPEYKKW